MSEDFDDGREDRHSPKRTHFEDSDYDWFYCDLDGAAADVAGAESGLKKKVQDFLGRDFATLDEAFAALLQIDLLKKLKADIEGVLFDEGKARQVMEGLFRIFLNLSPIMKIWRFKGFW